MIPRRLRLRNFLSYRDCELDFSGLQLATLVGRNGDGKVRPPRRHHVGPLG